MRKFLITAPLFSIAALLFVFQSNIFKNSEKAPPPKQCYYFEKPFYFFCSYEKQDQCFLEKIQSMLDQEYTNFSIVLFMEKKEKKIIESISLYAKRRGKSHLLEIIEVDPFYPLFLEMEKKATAIKNNEIVISLEKNCILTNEKFLTSLNEACRENLTPMLFFTSFTNYPSLIQNNSPISYETSPLNTIFSSFITYENLSIEISEGNINSIFRSLAKKSKYDTLILDNTDYLQMLR